MSAPRFAVETILGNVGVISTNQEFLGLIQKTADANNLELCSYNLDQLRDYIAADRAPVHDSWLLFLSPELAAYFVKEGRKIWADLTTFPHPQLYILTPYWQIPPLEIPTRATQIYLGEYLGCGGDGSPTLANLTQAIAQDSDWRVGEGGLSPFHLMSQEYLLSGIIKVLLARTQSPKINLANPSGVSLNTLAQFYSESLGRPLNIQYLDGGYVPPIPASFYRSTHAIFDTLNPDNTLDLALRNFKEESVIPITPQLSPPTPTPAPKTRLPKLEVKEAVSKTSRAYSLTGLEFVPESPKRKKLKFTPPKILKSNTFRVIIKGVVYGLVFYLGSLALAFGITVVTINNLQSQYRAGSLDNLSPSPIATLAAQYLYTNAIAYNLKEASLLLDAYQQALRLSDTSASLAVNVNDLSTHILTDQDTNLATTLTHARLNIENLYQQLSLLDGTLPVNTPSLLSTYTDSYQSLKNSLPTLKKNILLAKGVAGILPELIGLNDRTKYLVLFQNNMELRATGGFIGSYGLISFEKGKLYDFQVYDVYTADGALKGHVEPPDPIKNVLGEAKWYLRDSNFDPDFPTTARRAEWFLKKSMNQDVAGTIAINLETLRRLLEILGPLELADYQETINAQNLAERAQFHAEVNFFPGSTAKKEFLSSVGDALFAKLKSADSKLLLNTASALLVSLETSDTQLSTTSQSTERVLQTLGWSGAIENKPCPTSPCYDDYLYSVDSNFGVNKANFYVSKEMDLVVTPDKDGFPVSVLNTTWTNSATSNAWPAGPYKNYTRLYLPPSSSILSVQIGDALLSSSDYTISQEHGRLVLSYLITVPTNTKATSTVTYTNNTSLKSGSFYSLYLQRQSGVRPEDKITITYNLPLYLKPTKLSPEPASLEPQKLKFDFFTDADHRLSIQF